MMKQTATVPSQPMSKDNKKLDFYRRNINKIVVKNHLIVINGVTTKCKYY